jgi:hypothetical protein
MVTNDNKIEDADKQKTRRKNQTGGHACIGKIKQNPPQQQSTKAVIKTKAPAINNLKNKKPHTVKTKDNNTNIKTNPY